MEAGNVVVVTGAAHGIGAAAAARLAAQGWRLALLDRDGDALKQRAQQLRAGGADITVRITDLATADLTALVTELVATTGTPTCLVNAAGVVPGCAALDLRREEWDRTLQINLTSAFLLTQALGGHMLAAGRGAIINVTSQFAHVGGVNRVAYAASKGGLTAMTRALAVEWAPFGVRVNAVAPGPTRTRVNEERMSDAQVAGRVLSRIPLGRLAKPSEVAEAIAYLATAEYVTGTVLSVDGGYLAS